MKDTVLNQNFFNRDRNLVNFSNSLLKHFGVTPFHSTLPAADKALEGHKKVAVFLFDGMGEKNLFRHPQSCRYVINHKIETIFSTNPATTVAATDALLSGRYPIETGWLGWSEYFSDLHMAVDVFPNKDSVTGEKIPGPSLLNERCPYLTIADYMKEKGVKAKLSFESPLGNGTGPRSLHEFLTQASSFFKKDGGEFLYSYWTKPDKYLHEYGTNSIFVHFYLRRIVALIKRFVKANPDVLLFVIADHGLINVHYEDIAQYPDLEENLSGPLVLEPRTPSFFVKKGHEKEFEEAFKAHFSGRAVLMTKAEVLEKGYFGEGTPHPLSSSFFGDYVAVMLDETCLYDSLRKKNIHMHKGHHAGGTDGERLILISAYNV